MVTFFELPLDEDDEPHTSELGISKPFVRRVNSARSEQNTAFFGEEQFACELDSQISIDDETDEKNSLNEQTSSKSKIALDLLHQN